MFCRNYCRRGHGGTLIYRSLRLKRRCFPAIAQALFVEFSAVSAGLFYIRQTDGKSADKSSTDNAFMSADRRKKRR